MTLKNYELNSTQIDVLREIGNIGAGNAATALSSVVNKKIRVSVTDVKIVGYNEALALVGGPETIVAGVVVKLTGDIRGLMLYMGHLDFVNLILESLSLKPIETYKDMTEIAVSGITEISNILISSYMNAITSLADINVKLSVPAISINMAGAIIQVPLIAYGYQADKFMIIDGNFYFDDGQAVSSNLILVPDVESLSFLLKKLGVQDE